MITIEKVFIVNKQGELIIVQKRDNSNIWDIPSVQTQSTDSDQQIKTEISDELGIEIFRGNPFASSQIYLNVDPQTRIDVFEIGRVYCDCSLEPVSPSSASNKYSKIELVKIEDLTNYDFPSDVKPMIKKLIEIYKEYLELQSKLRRGTKHNPLDQLFRQLAETQVMVNNDPEKKL